MRFLFEEDHPSSGAAMAYLVVAIFSAGLGGIIGALITGALAL